MFEAISSLLVSEELALGLDSHLQAEVGGADQRADDLARQPEETNRGKAKLGSRDERSESPTLDSR